jgi:hypothetical protein
VFDDGHAPTGMNSAALKFIPKTDIKKIVMATICISLILNDYDNVVSYKIYR